VPLGLVVGGAPLLFKDLNQASPFPRFLRPDLHHLHPSAPMFGIKGTDGFNESFDHNRPQFVTEVKFTFVVFWGFAQLAF
jgi:hypothetical protein